MLGTFATGHDYPDLTAVRAKIASLQDEAARMKDDERIKRLVESGPHPGNPTRVLMRMPNWKLWSRGLNTEGEAQLKAALWPRVEPLLWARFEAQLDAHRRMETEAIEPDIAQKLTEREAKEWRTRVRSEKRQNIAADVYDIADLLVHVDGLSAQLKAIELADRPSCREISAQLERKLWHLLEPFPGQYPGGTLYVAPTPEQWARWKLGDEWDPLLAKLEARMGEAKDGWALNLASRQLANGYYRRDNFAKFEQYALRDSAFPEAVAWAAIFYDDFEAWRVLLGALQRWQDKPLFEFWQAQQIDPERRARALQAVMEKMETMGDEFAAKTLLEWIAPLDISEFKPHISRVENALESAVVSVKKWAMQILSKLNDADFDRERAAQTASESLWSENVGLAKDAAKFLATLAMQDADVAQLAWDALNDASALDNILLCEAVYRALVKIKSKSRTFDLSDEAHEKLELLARAQSERFGKFAAKFR